MTDVAGAIVRILENHGGWITPLTLRERLPNGMPRGEGFDAAIASLINSRRIQTKLLDSGFIYRLTVAPPGGDSAPVAPTPIATPGRSAAVSAAFNPPPPSIRVPAAGTGDDESRSPQSTTRETSMRVSAEQVLQVLIKKPMTSAEVAEELGIKAEAASYHLQGLAKARKIHKPDGRLGPWTLLNGHGTAKVLPPPKVTVKKKASLPPRPASVDPATWRVGDFALKVKTLEACIDDAKANKRTITAFILAEIRDDLERLAA